MELKKQVSIRENKKVKPVGYTRGLENNFSGLPCSKLYCLCWRWESILLENKTIVYTE